MPYGCAGGCILVARPNFAVSTGKFVRWLTRRPSVLALSRLLPARWRHAVRDLVNRLGRRGAMYERPVHLEFHDKARQPGVPDRVVILGAFFSDWNAALVDRALWQSIAGVTEVVRAIRPADIAALGPPDGRTVVVPLGEDHIRQCPAGYPSLVPDDRALEVLGNKRRFARFMEEEGFSALCPKTYDLGDVEFPCVLKRLDQNAAYGVELVNSPQELDRQLRSHVFAAREHLIQAFVPGDTEYATHCVCKDGEILWSCTFSRAMGSTPRIGGLDHDAVVPVTLAPSVRRQIADVLARLRYSGPCCVDHKIRDDGSVAIFEINPRFGGSLMTTANRAFLGQALSCIITNARWHP